MDGVSRREVGDPVARAPSARTRGALERARERESSRSCVARACQLTMLTEDLATTRTGKEESRRREQPPSTRARSFAQVSAFRARRAKSGQNRGRAEFVEVSACWLTHRRSVSALSTACSSSSQIGPVFYGQESDHDHRKTHPLYSLPVPDGSAVSHARAEAQRVAEQVCNA